MDNKINQNKIYNTQFKSIKPKSVKKSLIEGTEKMDELIKKMISDLKIKAKENVPSEGDFDVVWEEFPNPDKKYDVTHFILKISKPQVQNAENMRYLEAAALRRGTEYGAESVIKLGTKNEILDKLNENGIESIIKEKFKKLAKDIEDI